MLHKLSPSFLCFIVLFSAVSFCDKCATFGKDPALSDYHRRIKASRELWENYLGWLEKNHRKFEGGPAILKAHDRLAESPQGTAIFCYCSVTYYVDRDEYMLAAIWVGDNKLADRLEIRAASGREIIVMDFNEADVAFTMMDAPYHISYKYILGETKPTDKLKRMLSDHKLMKGARAIVKKDGKTICTCKKVLYKWIDEI